MQFNYKANLKWLYSFLGIFFVILLLLPNWGNAQVSISREGYPYCEPFIGGIDDIRRPDVTLFGDGNGPGNLASALTGQSIRLTANQQYKDGYVYLDLPFSPEYGIQVSFEYLSYGGTGADGIVFFMFDGAYGDLPPSLPFNIGGFGGSLGYAPRIEGAITYPGLSGAYIGVALDEWGNFISLESSPPNKPNGIGNIQYPHTVGIRGPESNNYEVFDYVEVNSPPRDPSERFTIDTPLPGLTCASSDYRKVYVNLSPRPDVGYDLTVQMLVGGTPYTIIGPTHYNFAAPETIKLGFSAATGLSTNYHEIRNLAVDVSKVEEAQRPEASDEFYRTCVDEELEIFIDVDLRSSDKAFIQCIQLYEDGLDINDPTAPWNTFSSDVNHLQCGLTPICTSCISDLSEKPTPLGTFTATIEDLDDSNFEDLRDRVQIVFTPNPGATGRSKIYYTITDNFGLTSKPKELVVIINPIPEFLAPPVIELPTCDGQNDGKITAEVGNLIPGFEHFWLYTNTAGVETNLGEGNVIGNVVSDGESAIFELEGVNVGQYVLVIRNPLDDGAGGYCEDRLIVPIIEDELGTPVTVDQDTFEICEGETVTIVPEVDPVYLNGRTPTFKWYKDAAKTQPITSNPSTPAPDGFTYQINAQGHLIVNGLVSQGGNPFVYNYYVELEEDRTGSQNLCSILGDLEIAATVTVFPAVSFDPPVIENDWCLGNSGSIDIVFRRGNEVLSQYVLLDEGGNEIRPVQSTGFFPGLSKGRYTVTGLASNPDCELSYDFEILGPDNTLGLDVINIINPSCELDNGSITWQASGGNGVYSFVSITGYPGASPPDVNQVGADVFEVNNLISAPPYTLTLTVQDSQGCLISSSQVITPQILPEFDVNDATICWGQTATINVSTLNAGFPSLNTQFKWYADASATQEIGGGNPNPWGIDFSVNSTSGTLTASNFPASPSLQTFEVYMKPILDPYDPSNPVVCDLPILSATITVNPLPAIEIVRAQSASCFGGNDGIIEVNVTNGSVADFEFMLDGLTAYQSSPVFNSGITAGNYSVRVRNRNTFCEDVIQVSIQDPSQLILTVTQEVDPSCDLDNGSLTFSIVGGTPSPSGTYTIQINGAALSTFTFTELSPNVFRVDNLPGGNYEILVQDQNACPATAIVDLIPQILPEYSLSDLEVCENEFASILPIIVNPGSPDANPVFRWYRDAAATDEILSGVDAGLGMTFTVNQVNGRLDISNFQNTGTYTFYLKPEILNNCPVDPIPVNLTVNPIPETDFEPVSPLCFGDSNGSLQLTTGGSPDYSYALVGNAIPFDASTNSFNGLPAGDYEITVTNTLTGCVQTLNKTIEPTPELIINLLDQNDPTCEATNGVFTFEVNGGVPDYTLTINGQAIADFDFVQTGNTYEIRSLAPGTYDVQVLDANDCVKALPTITLVNDEGLTVVVTPQDLVLCEGATAQILPDIQAPAGAVFTILWFKDAAYTEEISSGDSEGTVSYEILTDNTLEVSGLIPGDYTYYGRLQGAGICTIDFQSSVEILPPLNASLTVTPVTCFGDSNGAVLVENPTGGSGSYEFSIDGTTWQTQPLFENLSAGTYQLEMRDLNGEQSCYFVEAFEILGPAGPIVLDDFNQFVTSCGLDNGEIFNIEISGGWGNYTHQWTAGSPTGTPVTGTIEKVENLAPGLYYLTVTDSGGCSEVFEFEIGIAPDPEYLLVPPGDKCFSEQVALEAIHKAGDPNNPVARTEIAWYKNPNQSGLIADGPDPSNTDIVYTIVVDPNNFVNSTLLINGLPTGTYTYYLYIECTGEEIPVSFEIFEFPAMTITGVDESCYQANDGKIVVTGDLEPGMTFQVGSVTYTAAELANQTFAPGDYAIEVQGAVCSQIFQVSILAATEIKAALIDSKDAACGLKDGYLSFEWEGGKAPYKLTLTSAGGDTFTHQTSDLTYTFDGLGQGDYTLEIVDAKGCNFNLSNPIAINNGPSEIIVDRVYSTCDGIPVTIAPDVNPSNPNPIFTWYLGSISPGNKINNGFQQNGLTFNLNPRGNLTINGISVTNAPFDLWVTVEGPNICVGDEKQVTIEVFGNPEVQVTPVPELCFGDGGSLILNIPTNQNIEFSLNGGPYQAYPNSVIDGLPQGTYSLSAQNPSGCVIQIGNYTISGPSGPLEFQDLTAIGATCLSPNGQIFGTVAGGTSPYQVQVISDSGPIDPSFIQWNGNNFVVDNLSLGAYTVTLTDANLCEVSETGLTVSNEPLKVATDDVTICEGEVAVLTPRVSGGQGGGLTYSWFKDADGLDEIPVGISTDGNITYDLSTRGILTITGLKNSDSPIPYYVELDINAACGRELERALVTVNPIPNLRTSNPSIVCDPTQTVDLSLYIDGFDPNRYDYEVLDGNGNALRLDEIRAISKTGIYRVRMKEKGSNCYTPTERILVRIAEVELVANFDYQVEIVPGQLSPYAEVGIGDQIIFNDLTQGNPIRWEWDFGDGNTSTEASPTHIYEEIGTFLVMLKTWDDLGCESTAIIELVITDNFDIIFPNAFTPDRADGKNNLFFPKHRGLSSLEFYVFTTWGELIYESSSLEAQGWDGTFRGQPAINGNYVYRAKYTSRGGFVGETAGVFVLIR